MTTLADIRDIQKEVAINRWLEEPMTFQGDIHYSENGYDGFAPYTNGDYVNKFLETIKDLAHGDNYQIQDVNAFKDDIIRFVYTYSNA